MICRRCNVSNPDSSVYCERCGSVLPRRPAVKKKKILWYLIPACAAALIVCVYFGYKSLLKSPSAEVTRGAQSPSEAVAPKVSPGGGAAALTLGEIVVRGAMDEEISRMPAAIASGAWVALPIWVLIGGENIDFRGMDANEIHIEGGFWAEGDPVALWRVETGQKGEALELFPWKQRVPLEWQPLSTDSPSLEVEIVAPQKRGSFIVFSLPEDIRDAGVFRQESRIVGWTFGGWTNRGYLWTGPEGGDLVPTIRVDQFYASVFSRCREAYFRQALAMEKGTVEDRLRALAQGFRLPSPLESEDLPPELRPQSVLLQMHSLASELIQQGSAKEVIRILDDQVLLEAGEPTLVMDAVQAVAVRFNTGEESIRVAAYLNGTYYQNFVVDTGTSMTTIPSGAVEALKIRVDESTPVRAVLTASGMGVTYEVTLESIELEGLRVNNLKVLIIDLPGFANYGLLGLDFLNNFRFEIDKKQGILRLKKRKPS